MSVNQRIKEALKDAGISYERLAKHLGLSKQAVSDRLNSKKEIDSVDFINGVCVLTQSSFDRFKPIAGSSVAEALEDQLMFRRVEEKQAEYSTSDANHNSGQYWKSQYDESILREDAMRRTMKQKDILIARLQHIIHELGGADRI